MATIADLVALAKTYGIFEYYLPFVILFSLFYGLINKSKIFGTGALENRLGLILSFGAALYVMAYTPVGFTLTQFFATFFTQVTVVLVTLLAFMMILALLIPLGPGEGLKYAIEKHIGSVVLLGVVIAFGLFLSSGGLQIFPGLPFFIGLSAQDFAILSLVILTVLVIWWMTKSEGPIPEEEAKRRGIVKKEGG